MGTYVIRMPDIGEGIAEVELVAWRVQPGDAVQEDQILADVMTDKATVEIPSPVVGKVIALGGGVGQQIAVGAELIRLEVEGAGNRPHPGPLPQAGEGEREGAPAVAPLNESKSGAPPPTHEQTLFASSSSVTRERADVSLATSTGEDAVAPSRQGDSAVAPSQEAVAACAQSTGEEAVAPSSAGNAVAPSPSATGKSAVVPSPSGTGRVVAPSPPTTGERPGVRGPASGEKTAASGPAPTRAPGEQPIASPAVRRRAWDLGIELQYVHGSGPAGRIVHEDLDVYLASRGQPMPARGVAAYAQRHEEQAIPVIGLRRKIAQKMQEAKRRIPHFSYVEEIDVTELEALRASLNARYAAERGKLTLLPLIARAMVLAVRDFPQLNARFDDDAGVVTQYGAVHLGIATQTASGLVVPVVRHAEAHDVWACAAEIARLAEAARSGKGTREELSGSTITVTSLGPLGGIASTPVINHPEVAIVGVNRMVERPMMRQGAVVARQMMNLSSSFDHRVVDGMHAAEFVQAIRALLEAPAMLFVE